MQISAAPQALAAKPRDPQARFLKCVIFTEQGNTTDAIEIIRTHPSYTTAYENLGDVYAKLASQAYDKALQLDKTKPPVAVAQKPADKPANIIYEGAG